MTQRVPTIEQFLLNFRYERNGEGNQRRRVGVEREFFICERGRDMPAPHAGAFLERVGLLARPGEPDHGWTYELSACQVEHRTPPCMTMEELRNALNGGWTRALEAVAYMNKFDICAMEVAPTDMPLDVFPLPRYQDIAKHLEERRLRAACRAAGTHVHVECWGIEDAIRVYEALRVHLEELMRLGDHSNGERLHLYQVVTGGRHVPPPIRNAHELYEVARRDGWVHDLGSCWYFLRISRHGTVEVRVFGATADTEKVCGYVREIFNRIPL